MASGNKIYFASDFHLGTPSYLKSRERELRIVRWLDMIKNDASELYLLGDVFDFWFEYAAVIPKGYTRFLGKLAELSDFGIKITLFKGNHDMWMFDYLVNELGVTIVSDDLSIERHDKKIFMHHGDGLGEGDTNYKLLKKVFRSRFCQWLFARIHPNLGVGIANRWSMRSRLAGQQFIKDATDDQQQILVRYSQRVLKEQHYDFFIFGHQHLPLDIDLDGKSRYINLGEWVNYSSYAVLDEAGLFLKHFDDV